MRDRKNWSHQGGPLWRSAVRAVAVMLALGLLLSGCTGSRPAELGVQGGKLLPCPESPNCVSSDASDEEHSIAALSLEGDPAAAWSALRAAVERTPRTEVIEDTGAYMHVEFTSLLFRYVDDVEFDLRPAAGTIAVRSASRLGHSDMGANRKRVEALREALESAPSSQ